MTLQYFFENDAVWEMYNILIYPHTNVQYEN